MMLPLPLPDWVPWWATLGILIAGSLFALMFLLMPFAVFGVKGRLDMLEARLDEIQGEIRSLSLRLPEPGLGNSDRLSDKPRFAAPTGYDGSQYPDRGPVPDRYSGAGSPIGPNSDAGPRPPIPPAPRDRRPPVMPPRTEPRLF